MLVKYEKNKEGEKQADFVVLGNCLALQHGADMHRIALTKGQWKVLAETAQNRADDTNPFEFATDEGDDSDDPTSVLYEGHRKDQEAVAKALSRDKRIR